MTTQILQTELSNIIQDSKRKNAEVRNAAEKSLQDLKTLHSTSEAQLAADLNRRPHFILPFLLACSTQNAKLAGAAVICLQRLSISRAIPRERLKEVLDAFKESSQLGLDIQLKILQALPALLQNYSVELKGELLSSVLQVCSSLENTKNPVVSNTAAATLQQLVISVFDKVALEDEKALEIPTVAEVPAESGPVPVRPAAFDGYKVFHDLCLMIEGRKPEFVRFAPIASIASLELVEAILTNHHEIFQGHPEQGHILRTLLMPLIIRSLSERSNFPFTVRIIRILDILLRHHLHIMVSECEIALGLLTHMLDPEAAAPWKRALCMELFKGIFAEPGLALDLYAQYDETAGKKSILRDTLSAFVRLSTEKPAVIGLGQQTTAPGGQPDNRDGGFDQAAVGADAIAGIIAGPVNTPANIIGISSQWSSVRVPCMELRDKSEPPTLPDTYAYSLILTCINNLSEGLARFILPLTVHTESRRKKAKAHGAEDAETPAALESDKQAADLNGLSRTQSYRKRTVPINPLLLGEHPASAAIKSTAALITECWPAVLATCSTFLNASLDADYYRTLVRSIQKFTQVAGLLRLSTPRDAFLTTLGKSAVPSNVLTTTVSLPKSPESETSSMFQNTKGLLSVDSLVSQASSLSLERNKQASTEMNVSLNTRNLLCLRALLNLAIALGPTLEHAWDIVLEILQHADIVIAALNGRAANRDPRATRDNIDTSIQGISNEISAVQAAASRMFESTADFPNESFLYVLKGVCGLLPASTRRPSETMEHGSKRPDILHQRRLGSASGASLNMELDAQEYIFALNKMGDLATLNITRMADFSSEESGWELLLDELIRLSVGNNIPSEARMLATEILSKICLELAKYSLAQEDGQQMEIQRRILDALRSEVSTLHLKRARQPQQLEDISIEVEEKALDALKAVIEQCGENFGGCWQTVFSILKSIINHTPKEKDAEADSTKEEAGGSGSILRTSATVLSRKLAISAFNSVELVCSDFLASVPDNSLSMLMDLLVAFASQQADVNISLTTITYFWNVSDFLRSRVDIATLKIDPRAEEQTGQLDTVTQNASSGSLSALWLYLLLQLTSVTADPRAETRNGAVQTIFRIFDSYGEQLTPATWALCLRIVLLRVMEKNLEVQTNNSSSSATNDAATRNSWNETTGIILSSLSQLIATYLDIITQAANFSALWDDLSSLLQRYFTCRSHALNTSVFAALSNILSKAEGPDKLGKKPIDRVRSIWSSNFPTGRFEKEDVEANQDAFIAYARSSMELYRLVKSTVDTKTTLLIITNLVRCIEESDAAAYSVDIESLTELQKLVLDCLGSLRTDVEGVPSALVTELSNFVSLPFTKAQQASAVKKPTFIALAKASMVPLQRIAIGHMQQKEIFESGALLSALESLSIHIAAKYTWKPGGKASTMWQTATSTVLAIIESALEESRRLSLNPDIMDPIWSQIVHIADLIAKADTAAAPSPSRILSDEAFDIASLSTLRNLITPSLGNPAIPDNIRQAYTSSLFTNSLIHPPEPGEIPDANGAGPLENLYVIRYGRTYDPAPSLRSRMSYFCFTELISLLSVSDSSPERVKLAQAAAPYLLLRMALPIKAYIADQPLRGRLPVPESVKEELLFGLRHLEEMRSEDKAIPDTEGVQCEGKKHLHRLFALFVKAVGIQGGDQSVIVELVELMRKAGEQFGGCERLGA